MSNLELIFFSLSWDILKHERCSRGSSKDTGSHPENTIDARH